MFSEERVIKNYERYIGWAAEEYLKFMHTRTFHVWEASAHALGLVLGYSLDEIDNKIVECIREKRRDVKEHKKPVESYYLKANC